MNYVIAIDGPAGVGKTSVANMLSKKLDIPYISTGAFYRCVALKAMQENIEHTNTEKILEILENLNIDFKKAPKNLEVEEAFLVFLDGTDVTLKIKENKVSEFTAKIALIKELRIKLNNKFRELSKNTSLIMEGRDITTKVFPDSKYKFYFDANIDTRANRRFLEMQAKNIQTTFEEVKQNIIMRDENLKNGILEIAKDAIYIDTSNLSKDDVTNLVISYIDCTN